MHMRSLTNPSKVTNPKTLAPRPGPLTWISSRPGKTRTARQDWRTMKRYWETRIRIAFLLLAGILSVTGLAASVQEAEPFKFFREYVGLNDGEMNTIRSGKPVAKI